jgi:hypothetical protein
MSWLALSAEPLAFVRPQVLTACLAAAPAQWHSQLLALPRFRDRLIEHVHATHGLQPLASLAPPSASALAVAQLAPERFAQLSRLCGAIWHSATLAREVRAEVQQRLRQQLGDNLYALALAHRPLGGAADLLRDPDALVLSIDQDGAACLSQWAATLPQALRAWLALRITLPALQTGAPPINPAIVAAAAQSLLTLQEPSP